MKKFLFIALMGVIAMGLASCGKDEVKMHFTVTFDTDGGAPVPEVQRVEKGKTAVAPSPAPAKKDFVFVCWSADGTNVYSFQTPVTHDLTLRAKWLPEAEAEYWQVAWELNGGAWPTEGDNHATQVLKGGTLAEPAPPAKANHTFDGWYKEAALSNKVDFPYDVSGVTANFTLYAKWQAGGEQPQTGTKAVASGCHGCFILNQDGTLLALGHNDRGQLGTGNTNDAWIPTQVASDVSAVFAGVYTSAILKADGSLLGCGSNMDGQLGLEDKTEYHAFTPIPVSDVSAVATGNSCTLILKNDGSVWATGWNFYGQLGVGDMTARDRFTATNLTADVSAIAAVGSHSLALKKDGTVWGAGYGYAGALGANALSAENPSFVQIFSGAKAIAAGAEHSLILKTDGTVYASGGSGYGQTGTGCTGEVKAFTQAVESSGTPLRDVAEIFAGAVRSFALKTDGTLWAAGDNSYRQLAAGSDDNCPEFVKIASGVKSVSVGSTHSLVLKTDGTVQTLGYVNPFDQLGGNGTIEVKVNDTQNYDYITYLSLFDCSNTAQLHRYDNNITIDYTIKVKPGTYNLELKPKNATVSTTHNFTVPENGKVTVLYEWVSYTVGYRWTITISK
ncbi:InlB B-repeat-containing protein [Bacteroides heparinolyticus]|uniref:InlB B-repeat-containing protein n=1 Tax=Prevotella heparinolytica TaxID=28113 RepID=UPI00359F49BC